MFGVVIFIIVEYKKYNCKNIIDLKRNYKKGYCALRSNHLLKEFMEKYSLDNMHKNWTKLTKDEIFEFIYNEYSKRRF